MTISVDERMLRTNTPYVNSRSAQTMTLPTSATLPQRVVGTTTVLLRAIMKYRRQDLDSSAAVAGDSSAGLSHADDHQSFALLFTTAILPMVASITVRMPLRSIRYSSQMRSSSSGKDVAIYCVRSRPRILPRGNELEVAATQMFRAPICL